MWASTAHKTIRQEHLCLGIIGLFNYAPFDQAFIVQAQINQLHEFPVFLGMGRIEVIELDQKGREIPLVLDAKSLYQIFRTDAFFLRPEHRRRTVRIGRTNIDTVIADEFLKPDPDVGLDVLDQMADVDAPVRVGERAGDEDPA